MKIKFFLALSALTFLLPFNSSASQTRQSAVVTEVLTGDSVRLQSGKILKYASLQAPPLTSTIPLMREYGEDSLKFNKSLVENKTVYVEWGPRIRDQQNRLLGYVTLEDGTFVNEAILKNGHAKIFVVVPNRLHAAVLRKAELEARRSRIGLWKEEPENPYIKDEYLGEKNTKIYYFPTSPELERIPQANLVTFRSRVEAKAAGYRACSTCKESEEDPYQLDKL